MPDTQLQEAPAPDGAGAGAPCGPWYHGSRYRLRRGTVLEGGRVPINQGFGGPPAPHVYYTSKPDVAMDFAECAYGPDGDIEMAPRVYEVRPDETHERDPDEEDEADSWRARRATVIREVRL